MSDTYKPVYCHFNFRRPKGEGIGIFATCLYADAAGKRPVARRVREYPLWEDHQHVTAIQAYWHALLSLSEWQGKLMSHGVTEIVLVTDNGILAGWIDNPKKNKDFVGWMRKATSQFKPGGVRELMIKVALAEPRKSEKSYKYCKPELVENHASRKEVKRFKMDPSDIGGGLVTDLTKLADKYDDNGVQTVQYGGIDSFE